jgi:hypothetical protein
LPTGPQHRAQAEHNEFFVDQLDNPFWDWAVTGTFYTAVHYVDGYLISKGLDPPNHTERNELVHTDPTLAKIEDNYKQLYVDSRNARYDLVPFTKEDVRLLRDLELKPIKDLLDPLISKK